MKRSIDEIRRKPDQKAFDSLFFTIGPEVPEDEKVSRRLFEVLNKRLFAHVRGRKRTKSEIFFRHDCRAGPRPTRITPRDAHARADPARAHELAKDTAPSEPAPSGRAPRLDPTGTRPIRAFHLVVCQVSRRHARMRMYFFRAPPGAGRARARADARSRSARGRVRVRAHLPALPAGRGDGIAANPRPRRGASARAIERALFPAFFSARFKRPVGGPDGVLTESSPSRARAPCHAIPRLALARFQTRIVVASARAGWPRARDTRLPRRAPPPIFRARAKRTRRARPRKPPP